MSAATANRSRRRRSFVGRNASVLLAYLAFLILMGMYIGLLPRFSSAQAISIANQGMTLAIAALGQTLVILTGGVDLSIGPLIALTNSIAAGLMADNPAQVGLVVLLVLATGTLCGAINGAVIAYGRLQPIVVTLATSSIYTGCALFIRPRPGGYVPEWFTDALTGSVAGIPSALLLLTVLVVLWLAFRRTRLGVSIYAIGSSEDAAFLSGISLPRAKVAAYTLAGLFSAMAGLFFTAQTATGSALSGSVFTLNSVAAVVLGGTRLAGGRGGYIGTVAGAYVISVIVSVLFFLQVSPFYQSMFQGGILLLAVSIGSLRVLRVKNRLHVV